MGFEGVADRIGGGGDGQSDLDLPRLAKQIEVAQHQGRAGLNKYEPMVRNEDVEALPAEAVFLLQGLVGVADPAHPDRARGQVYG